MSDKAKNRAERRAAAKLEGTEANRLAQVEAQKKEDLVKATRHQSILDMFEVNRSFPYLARAAGRSVSWQLNGLIINIAASVVRNGRPQTVESTERTTQDGETVEQHNADAGQRTLDERNEADENARGADVEEQMHEDQGFDTQLDPMERGTLLLTIRNHIAERLRAKARTRRSVLMPDKYIYEPYDMAEPIVETFDKQAAQESRVVPARIKSELLALKREGVNIENVQKQFDARAKAASNFLKENKADVLGIIEEMSSQGTDALTAEHAWDKLPAIDKLRIMQMIDGAWYREADRSAVRWKADGIKSAETEMKMFDQERINFRAKVDAFMKDPVISAELDNTSYNTRMPVFLPLPKQHTM